MSKVKEQEPIVIAEVVELSLNGELLSNTVTAKTERHYEQVILNTYAFDLTKTKVDLFEKAIVSTLLVNGVIPATVVDVKVLLDGTKTLIVEFVSAVN